MKTPFFTVYNYGQGGVWTLLLAASREEIHQKYPELEVVDTPAQLMSDAELEYIRATRTVDIDDLDDPFLGSLRAGRSTESG